MRLELIAKRELYDPGIESGCNLTELCTSIAGIHSREVRVIENIKELSAKLNCLAFSKPEIFVEAMSKFTRPGPRMMPCPALPKKRRQGRRRRHC